MPDLTHACRAPGTQRPHPDARAGVVVVAAPVRRDDAEAQRHPGQARRGSGQVVEVGRGARRALPPRWGALVTATGEAAPQHERESGAVLAAVGDRAVAAGLDRQAGVDRHRAQPHDVGRGGGAGDVGQRLDALVVERLDLRCRDRSVGRVGDGTRHRRGVEVARDLVTRELAEDHRGPVCQRAPTPRSAPPQGAAGVEQHAVSARRRAPTARRRRPGWRGGRG